MSGIHNIIQNNQNGESKFVSLIPPDVLLGITIPKTIILDQKDITNQYNYLQTVKAGEINIYNNHNFNQISGVNKQNYVGENKANDNFIYIFYDYKNFEEKCLLKKGKIIDNIDMNNETELSYENNKKINIILNNSLINTFKLDETIVVNKDNKIEHEQDPQKKMQDQQQPINDIPINSKKEIKNNSNINAINNLKDAMKITIPIPNRMGGTYQQNFQKNFNPKNEKFKTEIKLGDVNNNNKNEQNLENMQALNNLLDNRTTKSRTIKIDFKENSINPSELSVLNNPTVKSVYQQA
jgi:hypothetical protein